MVARVAEAEQGAGDGGHACGSSRRLAGVGRAARALPGGAWGQAKHHVGGTFCLPCSQNENSLNPSSCAHSFAEAAPTQAAPALGVAPARPSCPAHVSPELQQ